MQTLFELISQRKEVKSHSERAELLKFFIENIPDKNGKQYKPAYMGMRLSHIPTKDLYYMISIFRDTEKRRGVIGARKEFWFSIKSKQ
jgi:hypothetical protein